MSLAPKTVLPLHHLEQYFPNVFARGHSFWLRKITTDHHTTLHTEIYFPDDRYPKFKNYISELILGSYEYTPVPYVTMRSIVVVVVVVVVVTIVVVAVVVVAVVVVAVVVVVVVAVVAVVVVVVVVAIVVVVVVVVVVVAVVVVAAAVVVVVVAVVVVVLLRVCLDSWRSYRGFSRQELIFRSGLPLLSPGFLSCLCVLYSESFLPPAYAI
jgi:hypothetical protein